MAGFKVRAVSTILLHLERFRRGDDEHPRAGDVRLDQGRRLDRVAEHGRAAFPAQPVDDVAVLVGDDVRNALRLERGSDALADASVADDHHLLLQEAAFGARRQLGQRVVAALQPPGQ